MWRSLSESGYYQTITTHEGTCQYAGPRASHIHTWMYPKWPYITTWECCGVKSIGKLKNNRNYLTWLTVLLINYVSYFHWIALKSVSVSPCWHLSPWRPAGHRWLHSPVLGWHDPPPGQSHRCSQPAPKTSASHSTLGHEKCKWGSWSYCVHKI